MSRDLRLVTTKKTRISINTGDRKLQFCESPLERLQVAKRCLRTARATSKRQCDIFPRVSTMLSIRQTRINDERWLLTARISAACARSLHVTLSFSFGGSPQYAMHHLTLTVHCGLSPGMKRAQERGRDRERRAKSARPGSMFHRAREIIARALQSGRGCT